MISIVIVNWNTGELLGQCLRSMADLSSTDVDGMGKVVVVDNASSDGSFQSARREFADSDMFAFVELNENVGFAGGNNIGVAKLSDAGRGSDDILLLNPDTEVRSGLMVALREVLARQKTVGVVGPKLVESDGLTVQSSVRRLPTLGVFVWLFLKLHRGWPESAVWQRYMAEDVDYDQEQAVEQVMGAAFLVRREVWRELRGLDEDFWIWFEEVDFCARARGAGWDVWYTPAGEVVHYGGVSFGKWHGFRKGWQWLRSCLVYGRRHLKTWEYRVLLVVWPVGVLVAGIAAIWQRVRH